MTRRVRQPELLRESSPGYTTAPDPAVSAAYRERLRAALQDPALRSTPGFPIADDDAILALSDPPYYTACPNPFLPEIMAQWTAERATLRTALGLSNDNDYHRDPFAADVSEGKNDPIYNAHSYHTKVPHKAIMRYILHYTDPGDIVLDGFCGTGMTGVAAQLCGDRKMVESLGYRVDDDGLIDDGAQPFARLGARKAVLVDLSPAATFIAYNYNTPVDVAAFEQEAQRILAEVEDECGWMYETLHSDGQTVGRINYTVWSDVLICPQCHGEMVFWDVAVDQLKDEVRDEWDCPHCGTRLCKNQRKSSAAQRVERVFDSHFDRALGQKVRQARQSPVLINYSVGKRRYQKRPDENDLSLISRIDHSPIPYGFPTTPLPDGYNTKQPQESHGVSHAHHFYSRRNLWVLASTVQRTHGRRTLFLVTALIRTLTIMFRWAPNQKHTAGTSGILYIPSVTHEYPIFDAIQRRIRLFDELLKVLSGFISGRVSISTGSASRINLPPSSVDYIFVDPPFGSNLMYSELNFLWEAWLQVLTNNQPEAVVNQSQRKSLAEYQAIMEACFREFYRVLKPGRWLTVEFHNSQNAVWNAIQDAILRAGFMVADVRTLDKQQGTFKQVTSTAAVKQDLVISAYKPKTDFEQRFLAAGGSVDAAWEFVRQHLDQLPIPQVNAQGVMEVLAERQPFLLFDRMVAFHIQRGLAVPLSAPDFYQGLRQRFLESDGMVFTPLQRAEYDKRRMQAEGVAQLALFVNDERSAIQWLRRELLAEEGGGAQTYQEIQPKFLRELHQARHEDLPELRTLLEENFIQDDDGRWYVPDPERQEDMERLRQKTLLREFAIYLRGRGRLRTFRSEAIRAGFSDAWKRRDYAAIVSIADRLPAQVIEEDASLLMYVNNARLRLGQTPQQAALL
ncbi:MAG: DNA methylase [Chloroflexota bacterium]|nr:MAG: DNA methylase [Chloroflexota bacterium]